MNVKDCEEKLMSVIFLIGCSSTGDVKVPLCEILVVRCRNKINYEIAKKIITTAPLQHGNQDGNMKNCESILHTNLLVKVHATFISYLKFHFQN